MKRSKHLHYCAMRSTDVLRSLVRLYAEQACLVSLVNLVRLVSLERLERLVRLVRFVSLVRLHLCFKQAEPKI